jgi:hypothetical protein
MSTMGVVACPGEHTLDATRPQKKCMADDGDDASNTLIHDMVPLEPMSKYLPVTIMVLLLGAGMALYPENIEIHIADEQVTLWTETKTTSEDSYSSGQAFSFRTGPLTMDEDGFMPVLKITNSGGAVMNATVVNTLHPEAFAAAMGDPDTELTYLLEETGSFDLEIEGSTDAESLVQVTSAFFYFRHVPPEMMTLYPYRFFGLGMAAVGLLTSAFVYVRGRGRKDVSEGAPGVRVG